MGEIVLSACEFNSMWLGEIVIFAYKFNSKWSGGNTNVVLSAS